MQNLPAIVAEWIIVIFIALLAAIVLVKIWLGTIDLSGLLSEPADTSAAATATTTTTGTTTTGPTTTSTVATGKASLSRLQLLLFTFVIAGLYLTLCLEAGDLIAIPNQVLGLLGISGGSYVVSKGIQLNSGP
jgi:hypothetical protein